MKDDCVRVRGVWEMLNEGVDVPEAGVGVDAVTEELALAVAVRLRVMEGTREKVLEAETERVEAVRVTERVAL